MGKNKFDPKPFIADAVYRKLQHERQKRLHSILVDDFIEAYLQIDKIAIKYWVSRLDIYELMGDIIIHKLR